MITSKKSLRNGCSTSPIDNNGRGSSHSESFFCGDVLSANGQVALSGDEYGMLRLWDTAKGETVYSVPSQKSLTFKQQEQERATGKTLLGHTGKVTACALSANGQVALSGDKYGRLLLLGTTSRVVWHNWSSSLNKVEKSVLSAEGMRALTCSRDSNSILNTRILRLWDTTSGETLRIWKFPIFWEVADCALSADGLRLFAVSNLMGFRAKLEVWDTSSGRRIRKLKGFKGGVGSCALSADGHVALSGARTAFLSTLLGNMANRSCLLALISGFWVFDNYEGSTLRVWDTKSGKTQRILQGHKDSVALCALSADGKLALSGSSKLVELEEDDTSLADPSEHCALRLWNTASNEATYTPQERHAAPVSGCVLSANGHRALTFTKNDGTLRVWDTASGQTLHILKHKQAVASCALSADGKLALSVCYDSGLRLWDTESGKTLHTWLYHIIGMKDCSLSADGRWALSLRVDGFLYLWDTINGQTLTQFLPEEKPDEGYRRWTFNFAGRGFALSADGCRALFVSKDGALQIWNREDIQEPSILEESLNNVDNWALSTDGQRVLAASEGGTLRIWNTESGHVLHTLKGHTGIVPMCALSANGRLALSASWDHTLRLWDTTSGQEIMRWTHDIALCSCSLSADGRVAVAGDIDGSVHFLEVVGVAKAEDIAAAKLPVSWLAEKSQSKPSLLRRLFGRHRRLNIGEKKEKEAEVLINEGPAENVHVNEQAQQRVFTLKAKKPGEMGEGRKRDRFAKFTERARKVLSLAQEEAQRFRHNYIGTEHLLLGLVRVDEGVAAKVLSNLGVELNKVHSVVEFIIGRGDRIVPGEIGLTPRAKEVIELAVDEARRLNHHYIGTEHLLLGLVREGEGIAAGVLEILGVTLEDARTQTMMILGAYETLSQPDQQEPVQHISSHEAQKQEKDLSNTTSKREASPLEVNQPFLPLVGDRFDTFTEQARNVLSLAQEEARRFQHGYIGTEHLLLGLIREDDGVAAKVLNGLGVKLDKIHAAVEYIIGRGDCIVSGEISLTPRAKKVIELAADEARLLNHDYIGPEHLLLGLVRLGEGIGAGVLQALGINIEEVRTQTLQMLHQRKVEEGNNS